MFVVDTNVLVYAAHPESEWHDSARAQLDQWRAGSTPWYLTWGICYEFLRVTTHAKVFRRPWNASAGIQFLHALFAGGSLGVLTPGAKHFAILSEIVTAHPGLRGNILHDTATAAVMREHGIRTIYTRDTDFYRFPWLEVTDPFA